MKRKPTFSDSSRPVSVRPVPVMVVLISLIACIPTLRAHAQLHPPEIRMVYPLGGSRGATTRVTINGMSFRDAGAILFDRPGVSAAILPPAAPALPPATADSDGNPFVTADFTVSDDAVPGIYLFRVVSPAGVSSVGKWAVGRSIPQIEAKEPNNPATPAQDVRLPIAVNGRIRDAGHQDTFAFDLEAGKTFVAEVMANVLDSPLDSLLTLREANGREVASNDDFNGSDSLLVYVAPKSGRYTLTIGSSVGIGGPAYAYRLSLGALPLLYAVFPVSVPQGKETILHTIGVNVPPTVTVGTARSGLMPVAVQEGVGSNAVQIAVSSLPTVQEQEPNDDIGHATPIPVPGIANGQFWRGSGKAGEDLDYYRFHAESARPLRIDAQCQALGLRGDPTLQLLDGTGKVLMENDDAAGRDAHLDFTAPATADYYLRVKDVAGRSAPDMAYRLVIQDPPAAGFALSTETRDRVVGRGDNAAFEVTVERTGWDGPVTLAASDLPAGVTATSMVVPAGVTRGLVVLSAAPNAAMGAFPLHIVGSAQVNGRNARQMLTRAGDWVWRGGARTVVPTPADFVTFAVGNAFEVAPTTETQEASLLRNSAVKVKVHLNRRIANNKPVTLRVMGLPDGVTAADVVVPPTMADAEVEIKATPAARMGAFPIVIDAVAANSPQVELDRATTPVVLTVSDPPKK